MRTLRVWHRWNLLPQLLVALLNMGECVLLQRSRIREDWSSGQVGVEAPLTEEGYQRVASAENDEEMSRYIIRVIENDDMHISNGSNGDLNGLTPWYSGTASVQSLAQLRAELDSKTWVVKPVDLSEEGYLQVVKQHSYESMKHFVERALRASGRKVKQSQEEQLDNFMHKYSGIDGFGTFELMRQELMSASWLVTDLTYVDALPLTEKGYAPIASMRNEIVLASFLMHHVSAEYGAEALDEKVTTKIEELAHSHSKDGATPVGFNKLKLEVFVAMARLGIRRTRVPASPRTLSAITTKIDNASVASGAPLDMPLAPSAPLPSLSSRYSSGTKLDPLATLVNTSATSPPSIGSVDNQMYTSAGSSPLLVSVSIDSTVGCADVQPPKGWDHNTCEAQKQLNDCPEYVVKLGYCTKTCGRCGSQASTKNASHLSRLSAKSVGEIVRYKATPFPRASACTDKSPPHNWEYSTCEDQKKYNRCADWLLQHGYCAKTCGKCE